MQSRSQKDSQASQQPLPVHIDQVARAACDSPLDDEVKKAKLREYDELIESIPTWKLLPALNSLVRINRRPAQCAKLIMETLSKVPMRSDGVRSTMEYVFSVHPSSASRAAEMPQKQGANITQEAVAMVTGLLSKPPASVKALDWFQGIAGQLFALLDGVDGPDLARVAAQVIGFGILGRKETGSPGQPGWQMFVWPIHEDINPTEDKKNEKSLDDAEVIDFRGGKILVTADALERAMRRLSLLILSNGFPSLCGRVLKPILTQLWVLASWSESNPPSEISKSARRLLQTYLRLFGGIGTVSFIAGNLLESGASPTSTYRWSYQSTTQGGIEISSLSPREGDIPYTKLPVRGDIFADLLISSCDDISKVFIDLLRRWLMSSGHAIDIEVSSEETNRQRKAPAFNMMEVVVLEKLLQKAPDKLVSHFDQLMGLISHILQADEKVRMSDDLIGIVLSLLNLVITAPSFSKSDLKSDQIETVIKALERLYIEGRPDISQTARNLSMLMRYRTEFDEEDDSISAPSARVVEDRQKYALAMEYITGADNPPPVVSEGLIILSKLVDAQSSTLDVNAVTVLMSHLLQNNEDYINLRVIKMFSQLSNNHPKTITQEILDNYVDANEKLTTDVRLRFGEALVQVIERLGQMFTGELSKQISETLLYIGGRRARRPKTKAKQEREERMQKMEDEKTKKAQEKGTMDYADDDDNDDYDERLEDEKAIDDALAHIVRGWDSKRGAEDIRMRASALSILGLAIEVNIGGVGPTLISMAVDFCLALIGIEKGMEAAILRRAAVRLILSFAKGMETAKEEGRYLGFGLLDNSLEEIKSHLGYLIQGELDHVVIDYAKTARESLENLQMASLIPTGYNDNTGRIVVDKGLPALSALNMVAPDGESGGGRPRIEEVE